MHFTIRPWHMNDLESLVLHANNPKIAQFMTDGFPHPYSIDNGKAFIEFATKDDPIHIFAIDVDGQAVGGIGIHSQSDIMKMNAELGYWLSENYWGKGIITRAIEQMIDFTFKTYPVNRIYARPFCTNIASQKVLEKAGFKLEARFEKTILKNGQQLDELIYAYRRTNLG